MWINQNENIQFLFNFTGNLSTHEPHAKDHPHSHPSDTPRAQTYQAMFLSISPLLNVFLSAAERSHNCIKSDVYDCRFDFSTHQYLLAASSSLPSAVPHFCLYLTMLHLVYLPAGLLVDTCVGSFCWATLLALSADETYRICPGLSTDPNLFGNLELLYLICV